MAVVVVGGASTVPGTVATSEGSTGLVECVSEGDGSKARLVSVAGVVVEVVEKVDTRHDDRNQDSQRMGRAGPESEMMRSAGGVLESW